MKIRAICDSFLLTNLGSVMKKNQFRLRLITPPISLIVGLLFSVQLVHAHALLVRSTPEAGAELAILPPTIEIWFSEPLEAGFSTIYLVDGAGNEIGRGLATIDPNDAFHMSLPITDLTPGFYTVVWETLSSADGHSWVGSFPLTLLNPDGSRPSGSAAVTPGDAQQGEFPKPLAILSRWLGLLGAMLAFGALFMRLQIAKLSVDSPQKSSKFVPLAQQSVRRVLLIGLAGVILGGWLHWLNQALGLADPTSVVELILGTRSGNLVLIRQLLAGVLLLGGMVAFLLTLRAGLTRLLLAFALLYAVGLLLVVGWLIGQQIELFAALAAGLSLTGLFTAFYLWFQKRATPFWPQLQRAMNWLLLILAALMLVSFAVGGHAAAVVGSFWAILGDLLHLIAAAIWLGGLIVLALILWQMRGQQAKADAAALRVLVARFSAIATVAIFALTVTGIFSSFVQLRVFEQLWTTTYGWMLLAKLALVGVTLLIALFNHRFVSGADAARWTTTGDRPFLQRVWTEAIVSLVLMIVVAILVQTPVPLPPTSPATAASTLYQEILRADDLSIHLQVTPNQPGNNRYQTHLYHDDGSEIGEVQLVRLFFVHQTEELGQSSLDLVDQGDGLYAAEGAYQNRSGPWDVSIYVRRRGLDDALAETTVIVTEPTIATSGSPWQTPIPAWPPDAPLTGLVIAIILGLLIWRRVERKMPGY